MPSSACISAGAGSVAAERLPALTGSAGRGAFGAAGNAFALLIGFSTVSADPDRGCTPLTATRPVSSVTKICGMSMGAESAGSMPSGRETPSCAGDDDVRSAAVSVVISFVATAAAHASVSVARYSEVRVAGLMTPVETNTWAMRPSNGYCPSAAAPIVKEVAASGLEPARRFRCTSARRRRDGAVFNRSPFKNSMAMPSPPPEGFDSANPTCTHTSYGITRGSDEMRAQPSPTPPEFRHSRTSARSPDSQLLTKRE